MVPPNKGPGLMFRLYTKSSPSENVQNVLNVPGANTQKITTISSADDKVLLGQPNAGIIYDVLHISRFLLENAYSRDPVHSDDSVADLQWHVYKRMFQRSRTGLEATSSPAGSVVVCVGVTPCDGTEDDYCRWFDEEHAELLSLVPGWRSSARYALAGMFGGGQAIAPFLAVHFYDKVNGLGGAEWMRSTETEWTQKIRNHCAKPHFRRVWTVESEQQLV